MEEDSILYELILPKASIPDEVMHMEYETPIIEVAHKTTIVKRILLKEVNLREKRLFGKFKGSGRWKKKRELYFHKEFAITRQSKINFAPLNFD